MQDQLLRTSTSSKGSEDPDSLGKSSGKKEGKKVFEKGAKTMRVACYADAPREPELIGEAVFDLAKALNTGEDDGEFVSLHGAGKGTEVDEELFEGMEGTARA